MPYLIDGYNLLHAMGVLRGKVGPQGLEKARLRLLGLLRGVYGKDAGAVTVVNVDDIAKIPIGFADQALQEKAVEAWAYALAHSSFKSIHDIPPAGNPDVNEAKRGDQTDHLRGVTRLAIGIAKEMGAAYPELAIDMDVIIAGGGLAGIVTAFGLLDRGKRVLLIEKDTQPAFGGLAKLSFGGVHWHSGAPPNIGGSQFLPLISGQLVRLRRR